MWQGRLFYEAAVSSPLGIRTLQMYYGMVGFAKTLLLARHSRSAATLPHAHGLKDVSRENSRIAELRLRIEDDSTFQEFNDVVAEFSRVRYIGHSYERCAISTPSAKSAQLRGLELSLRDILTRIPELDSLYRMTFGEEALTATVLFDQHLKESDLFELTFVHSQRFSDRESLKHIVGECRARFLFLKDWRLHKAWHEGDKSVIEFRNTRNADFDEFDESQLEDQSPDGFFGQNVRDEKEVVIPVQQVLRPLGGSYGGQIHAISPVNGLYLSEFSLHYLGLFLLSSLVRYRPQTWAHAISRSVMAELPADDQASQRDREIPRYEQVSFGPIVRRSSFRGRVQRCSRDGRLCSKPARRRIRVVRRENLVGRGVQYAWWRTGASSFQSAAD